MRALLTGECKGQEWRAVEGEYVYIVLSKESNCWAKMQNPDKVLGGEGARHGPAEGLCL
jgi:hypothetical protein